MTAKTADDIAFASSVDRPHICPRCKGRMLWETSADAVAQELTCMACGHVAKITPMRRSREEIQSDATAKEREPAALAPMVVTPGALSSRVSADLLTPINEGGRLKPVEKPVSLDAFVADLRPTITTWFAARPEVEAEVLAGIKKGYYVAYILKWLVEVHKAPFGRDTLRTYLNTKQ